MYGVGLSVTCVCMQTCFPMYCCTLYLFRLNCFFRASLSTGYAKVMGSSLTSTVTREFHNLVKVSNNVILVVVPGMCHLHDDMMYYVVLTISHVCLDCASSMEY